MELTLIIPHDEGTPDINGDISSGIQIYPGRLTLAQLVYLTTKGGEAYPRHAILEFYNEDGTLDGIQVTFHNDDAEPASVREHYPSGQLRVTGTEYNDVPGIGHLMYTTEYTRMCEVPAHLEG